MNVGISLHGITDAQNYIYRVACSQHFTATKAVKKWKGQAVHMANPSSNSAASKKQVDVQSNKQISQDINPMSVALEKNKRLQDALESGDAAGVIALFSPMNKWIIELRLWNSTQKVSQ